VFENLLGQNAAGQLIRDIEARVLAPAMLFSGPPASGKGTAALELGRILSCEDANGRASWNCGCPACSRHRLLIHPDLICLGPKPFSAEIAASYGAFLREKGSSPRMLFIRSVRKLLTRFNPVFWEDDSRGKKIIPLVDILKEDLDEFEESASREGESSVEKSGEGILKNAFRLESEGMGEIIPIAQLRRASAWCHLSPSGKRKLFIIENADRMQEEARNSLLKLLEEPPPRVSIVLTCSRPGSLLLTILSRLRPYRFEARPEAVETDVVRRVFRDDAKGRSINSYLDSFLPVSADTLEALASFFTASVAFKAALICKNQGRPISGEAILLGKFSAPRAEAAGFGRPRGEAAAVCAIILEKAARFEIRSLFTRFLYFILEQISLSQRQFISGHNEDGRNDGQKNSGNNGDGYSNTGENRAPFTTSVAYNELWKENIAWGETAAGLYNLRPALVLEKMFTDLSRALASLSTGSAL